MERAGNDAATRGNRLDDATSASLVQQLFDHSPIGMAVLDPSGRMVDVNPAMAKFLQRPRHDLLQLSLADVTHPADATVDGPLRHELLAGTRGSYRLQERFVRMDGTVAWGDVSVSAVRDEYGTPCRLIAQVADITAEREHQEELAERSSSDPLTGLANRSTVLTLLGHALRLPEAVGTLAVLYVDLDGFKEVNDTLGHAAGDHLLTVMADRMVEIVGRVGVVGRMGGDEFVVVVDEADGPDEVEALADALRRELAGDVAVEGSRCRVTVSIGVAFPHRGLDDPEELVRAADTAMYRAKRAGKDRWERFDHVVPSESDEAARLEAALGAGSVQGRVVPWFQPVVELATGAVVGHEALVRWQHPELGVLRPAQFMPAAEDRGLSARVDDAVLAHACAFLAAAGSDAGFVSVNLSLASVLRDGLADRVRRALDAHGVDPSALVVELTEVVTLQLPRHARRDLESLDADGVRVFVDDFGTGYGALSIFDEVPVRGVKLDRSLIGNAATVSSGGQADRLLVGLRHLADGLGLMGVVEGIETDEELERVRAMGWTHGQGYLLGAPAPAPAAG